MSSKFKEIPAVPNLPQLEKETTDYWTKLDVVEKLKQLRGKYKGTDKERVYYDGPITANGIPHYGHAITWTLKDVIPRYWAMKGYYVDRDMGWDCQGIPVEYEVEKELKFQRKDDIEKFGIEKFNKLCREAVEKYQGAVYDYESKLGRWFDKSLVYATMNAPYIESIWWSLKELYKKELLYEGYKVVAYSTRAGTSLSTHEVNDGGYADVTDTFVTVKFELVSEPKTYILAWTTTPWTMPGNLLLAVGKKIEYAKVQVGDEKYILAQARLAQVLKDKEYKVLETFTGDKLVGLDYKPPFNYFEAKRAEGCFKVVHADHANIEDGTGIVHLAPYGAEDFDVFMKLGIQIFDYLDEMANFTDMIPEYAGLFYKQANPKIVEHLGQTEVLFNTGDIVHRMPMCWRTGTPLIYKPVKSWYVAVTKIKEKMAAENQRLGWHPEHVKDGNSAIWINNARDWALSRSRYWGTPLPVWVNDTTGEKVVIGSFAELKELSGVELADPHKPFVDDVTWEDSKNGGTFKRVKDVIDVWYDSGSMPFARLHYPFANTERFKQTMPADYIAEGPDQIRLWFYVMHVLGVALFNQVPYKNVVTIGMMLGEDGKKMSKSKKNYTPMDEILAEYGGDILRFFILNSSIVSGSDAVLTPKMLAETRRDFFLTLWNSLKYFLTYANQYDFNPTADLPKSDTVLDQWILARLKEVTTNMTAGMDAYELLTATKQLQPFVVDLSTWYIRRSRDRIKEGDKGALATLYYVLVQLAKLMAPITPFIAETMYHYLKVQDYSGLDSVHFDFYPEPVELTSTEKNMLEKMENTRGLVSSALALRIESNLKVRQPLRTMYVERSHKPEHKVKWETVGYFDDLIKAEVNVKEIKEGKPEKGLDTFRAYEKNYYPIWLDLAVDEELALEGAMREMVRSIQGLRKEQGLSIKDQVDVKYPNTPEFTKVVAKFGEEIKNKVLANSLTANDTDTYELVVSNSV